MKRLIVTAILICLTAVPAISLANSSLIVPGGFLVSSVHSRCVSYARIAVGHNAANQSHRCRFSGAAWSSSVAHHYRWCRSVNANGAVLAQARS
ncbi:MAG: hypothetical protein KKC37_01510, partial [Proteobacteria bacterium]|nr:hypothetical protein [Pseudomonadota bacterium]